MKEDRADDQRFTARLRSRVLKIAAFPGARVEQARTRLIKIPFFGFLNEAIEGMGNDGASEVVGGISYYVILSLFPLLLGVISILGFFLPSATIQDQIFKFVETNLPTANDILRLNITGIIKLRGPLGIVSIVALFWSASAMFSAINRGVNRAWGLNVRHPFVIRKAREVAMSLSACVFFYIAVTVTAVLASFDTGGGVTGGMLFFLSESSLVFFVFLMVYKTMPLTKTYWRYVWPGALFSTAAFELARAFLGVYLTKFSHVELVYGSIASIIILLIFAQYVAFILIMGLKSVRNTAGFALASGSDQKSPQTFARDKAVQSIGLGRACRVLSQWYPSFVAGLKHRNGYAGPKPKSEQTGVRKSEEMDSG